MGQSDAAVAQVAADFFVLGPVEAVFGEEFLKRAVAIFSPGGARNEGVEEGLHR